MTENLLSALHVQKLGHNIEEIRTRALSSIISKFDMNLIDENDLVITKQLLEKLLAWFSFTTHPKEERVLSLILRIMKRESSKSILCDMDISKIMTDLQFMENKLSPKCLTVIHEIKNIVMNCGRDNTFVTDLYKTEMETDLVKEHSSGSYKVVAGFTPLCNSVKLNYNDTDLEYKHRRSEDISDENKSSRIFNDKEYPMKSQEYTKKDDFSEYYTLQKESDVRFVTTDKQYISEPYNQTGQINIISTHEKLEDNTNLPLTEEIKDESSLNTAKQQHPVFRDEILKWQPLVHSDLSVLSSMFDGLRYIDNKDSIIQSCHFFKDVILQDFPGEIFIQRPLIIKTFFELLDNSDVEICLPIVSCITDLLKKIQLRVRSNIDVCMFNNKEVISKNMNIQLSVDSQSEESHTEDKLQLTDDIFNEDLSDTEDYILQLHQMKMVQFCTLVLVHSLPHLSKKYNVEQYNALICLIEQAVNLMIMLTDESVWSDVNAIQIKEKIFFIFTQFETVLKYHKKIINNRIIYIDVLSILLRSFIHLIPISKVEVYPVIPRGLQLELLSSLSDPVLVLFYPELLSWIMAYISHLPGQNEKEVIKNFSDSLLICESMKSCVRFMKHGKELNNSMEILKIVDQLLPSLSYIKSKYVIDMFIELCFTKFCRKNLKKNESKLAASLLLKFLSFSASDLKLYVYERIHKYVTEFLGVIGAKKFLTQYPGDKVDLLFNSDILTEIICHGANSQDKVRKYAEEILVHLLKGKFLTLLHLWEEFIISLLPCIGLLQCLSNKSTQLGCCVSKMLDPDFGKSISLPFSQVLKGNLRFLFSKDSLLREEAISRLCWILTREDNSEQKLPKINLLQGINLNSLCIFTQVQESQYYHQSFYSTGSLCEVIELLNAVGVEPQVRRSALSQISVMMEDYNLHSVFVEQKGLDAVLSIFENCLMEKKFHNYADSVLPIISILKNLVYSNATVRQELSVRDDILILILRGLLLFSGNDAFRRDGSQLLCLLVYSDNIIGVPPARTVRCTVSLPEIIVTKMSLPFLCYTHWKESQHTVSSLREVLLKKGGCAPLLRSYWAVLWTGELNQVLSWKSSEIPEDYYTPGLPNDMKITPADVKLLKASALAFQIKSCLYDVQNATTHQSVLVGTNKLFGCLLTFTHLKRIKPAEFETHLNISYSVYWDDILKLPWEATFERFLTAPPSCQQDEELLLNILRLLTFVLKHSKSYDGKHKISFWITRILSDHIQPLPNMLRHLEDTELTNIGREVRHSILNLFEEVLFSTSNDGSISRKSHWMHLVEILGNNLKLKNSDQFYNVAYLDWTLTALVNITGTWSWDVGSELKLYEDIVNSIVQIIVSFHSIQKNSPTFMGISIVRNCLFVLNHLLYEIQSNTKGWEQLWLNCLTKQYNDDSEVNYSWILSLWFNRDPLIRASSVQLLEGFTTTQLSCELLIERTGIEYYHLWTYGFNLLLDVTECCIVRERAALLLANLTSHGTRIASSEFLDYLTDISFYDEMRKQILKLCLETNIFKSEIIEEELLKSSLSTPGLVKAIGCLLLNVFLLNPLLIMKEILKSDLLISFIRVFDHLSRCVPPCQNIDILEMYTTVVKLLSHCLMTSSDAYDMILHSHHCIRDIYSLLDADLYDNQTSIMFLRNNLWTNIFDFFSVLLCGPLSESETEENARLSEDNMESERVSEKTIEESERGFLALKHVMTQDGCNKLLHAIYIISKDCRENKNLILLTNLINQNNGLAWLSDILDDTTESVSKYETYGAAICDIIMQQYTVLCSISESKSSSNVQSVVNKALCSVLLVSHSAKMFALEQGLLDTTVLQLKEMIVKLNLETLDCLRKSVDRKRLCPLLVRMERMFQILTDFISYSDEIKTAAANLGLCDVIHKLWLWCNTDSNLIEVVLKMLCTLTCRSSVGAKSLALTSSASGIGLKKTAGSSTLIHAIVSQVIREMDLISKTHNLQILSYCLQLLSNCCVSTECRAVLCKGQLIPNLVRINPVVIKKRPQWNHVMQIWFKFLKVFTSYQEGQLALPKNPEALEVILTSSKTLKSSLKLAALTILRNMCFHQLNRTRLLTSGPFLNTILEILNSRDEQEFRLVVVMIWALAANNQKSKIIIRNAGIENKLIQVLNGLRNSGDDELVDSLTIVIQILQNKS